MAEHEHNKDNTKRKILDAALREFGGRGYGEASTNRICRVAGISKGLLFHHFGSKEKLFSAVLEQCLRDFQVFTQPEGAGKDCFCLFYRRRTQFFSEHPWHYAVIMSLFDGAAGQLESLHAMRVRFEQEKEQRLSGCLHSCALREGVSRKDALELIAAMSAHLQEKYLKSGAAAGGSPELTERFMRDYDHILSMLLHGILQAPEGGQGCGIADPCPLAQKSPANGRV